MPQTQTEQSYKGKAKILNQLQYCEQNLIPLAVVIGKSEVENNVVKIRNISDRSEVSLGTMCNSNYYIYI